MPDFRCVRDILKYAVAKERQAHDFYVALARQVQDPERREAIRKMALDEAQHAVHLEAIQAGEVAFDDEEVGSLNIAETLGDAEPTAEMSYADLLKVAMTREKAAFRLYTNLATLVRDPAWRATLLHLAQEEAQHKLKLEIEYDWTTF